MNQISVLILTLNEEANLNACLDSCAWCDDVVVLDSFSSDRTCDVARSRNARVVQRRFDNYAAQRNSGLNDIQYRHPWILMLDADERVSPELAFEIAAITAAAPSAVSLFRMRRKDYFLGRWLRRSSGYPTWFGRLVRAGHVRVEREVNEEYHTEGQVAHLTEHLIHFPFNRGVAYWYERHNRYSTMEARAKMAQQATADQAARLFAADAIERRRALKQLGYRLRLRPLLVFGYLYFLRLGLLDGVAGLYYCAMRASYELMIDVKVRELRRLELGQQV